MPWCSGPSDAVVRGVPWWWRLLQNLQKRAPRKMCHVPKRFPARLFARESASRTAIGLVLQQPLVPRPYPASGQAVRLGVHGGHPRDRIAFVDHRHRTAHRPRFTARRGGERTAPFRAWSPPCGKTQGALRLPRPIRCLVRNLYTRTHLYTRIAVDIASPTPARVCSTHV